MKSLSLLFIEFFIRWKFASIYFTSISSLTISKIIIECFSSYTRSPTPTFVSTSIFKYLAFNLNTIILKITTSFFSFNTLTIKFFYYLWNRVSSKIKCYSVNYAFYFYWSLIISFLLHYLNLYICSYCYPS